jgi:hypothetical protein
MTKRDYIAFAKMIKEHKERIERGVFSDDKEVNNQLKFLLGDMVSDMRRIFAGDNPRFSSDKFNAACGFGKV